MENKVEIEAFTQSHLREVKTKIKKKEQFRTKLQMLKQQEKRKW